MKKLMIFLRDDDVYDVSKNLLILEKILRKNNIPIAYSVIPKRLKKKCSIFLIKNKLKFPKRIDILQHGCAHTNMSENPASKFEFDRTVSYKKQKQDIQEGKKIMDSVFADQHTSSFVPPFHKYDLKTLTILEGLGFQAFSANFRKETNLDNWEFINMPVHLNLNVFDTKGKYVTLSFKDMISNFNTLYKNQMITQGILGICLHHNSFTEADFKNLIRFLKYLKSKPGLEFISFPKAIDYRRSNIDRSKKSKNKIQLSNLTLSITNKCNLKCKMCNIWHEKHKKYLSFEDIKKILLSEFIEYPIKSVSLTGGEFLLHPQIDKILRFLIFLKTKKKISNLCLVTNGYNTALFRKILLRNSGFLNNTDIFFSLDGCEDMHNKLRQNNQAYRFVFDTISMIESEFKEIRKNINLKFAINKLNIGDINYVYQLCKEKNLKLSFKLYEEKNLQYYHKDSSINHRELTLKKQDLNKVREILKNIIKKEIIGKKRILNLLYIDEIIHRIEYPDEKICCITPKRQLFIDYGGNVYPCLYMKKLANIYEKNWDKKIMNQEHKSLIKKGVTGKCPGCLAYHGFLKRWNLQY